MKKYSRVKEITKKLDEYTKCFKSSPNPERFGDMKTGRYKNMYGIAITKSIRLIYKVDHTSHKIIFYAIGDHKEVYGND